MWAGPCVMMGSPGAYSLALVSLTWAEFGSSCLSPLIPRRSMLSLMLARPEDGSMFSWPGSVSSSTSACSSPSSSRSPESSCASLKVGALGWGSGGAPESSAASSCRDLSVPAHVSCRSWIGLTSAWVHPVLVIDFPKLEQLRESVSWSNVHTD